MEYYARVSEHHYTIDPGEPTDPDNPYTYHGAAGLSASLEALSTEKLTGYDVTLLDNYEELYGFDKVQPGETAYVLFVIYTDGDTFGSSQYWTIPAIKSNITDAKTAQKKCYEPFDGKDYTKFRSWDGYFASLDSCEIVPIVVT